MSTPEGSNTVQPSIGPSQPVCSNLSDYCRFSSMNDMKVAFLASLNILGSMLCEHPTHLGAKYHLPCTEQVKKDAHRAMGGDRSSTTQDGKTRHYYS